MLQLALNIQDAGDIVPGTDLTTLHVFHWPVYAVRLAVDGEDERCTAEVGLVAVLQC